MSEDRDQVRKSAPKSRATKISTVLNGIALAILFAAVVVWLRKYG